MSPTLNAPVGSPVNSPHRGLIVPDIFMGLHIVFPLVVFASLGVGGVRPDMQRRVTGQIGADALQLKWIRQHVTGAFKILNTLGVGSGNIMDSYYGDYSVDFDTARIVPVGPRNHGPRWISDARVYLGIPAS